MQCLEHISSTWPRDGILRVEIVRSPPEDYNIEHSYQKERKLALRHRELDHLGTLFSSILTGDSGYSEPLEAQETESNGEKVQCFKKRKSCQHMDFSELIESGPFEKYTSKTLIRLI